jgi:NAD(P)-dependent dehydrogenase (short-subunit alcohol dehydrogenase family)
MGEEGALHGRVALVTGGTRGIGRGCALELAAAGATVYATGRTRHEGDSHLPGSLDSLEAEAGSDGGQVIGVVCDHRSDEEVAAAFARVREEQGRIDMLVNSAFLLPDTIEPDLEFWRTPIGWWDDMIDVGTRSAYVASHHAAQMMTDQRSGLIANISSAGARNLHLHVAYSTGKAALDRMTIDMATQLTPFGVAVVSIWPYFVRTERLLQIEASSSEGWDHDIEGAESQRFVGRTIVALSRADDRLERSGGVFTSAELAIAYGVRELDGRLPSGPRSTEG